jgi:hypothetical protein
MIPCYSRARAAVFLLSSLTGFAPVQGEALDHAEAALEMLEWRNVGPMRGGRSIAAAGSVQRPNEYYFGATGGGLWKSTDGGGSWFPVTDGQIDSASVQRTAATAGRSSRAIPAWRRA